MRILVVLLIFLAGPALAIEMCDSGKRVTCVVDGDTLWFRGEKIRMMGYDTPEAITGICGGQKEIRLAARASKRLVQLLNQNTFTIERDGKDKYGRTQLNRTQPRKWCSCSFRVIVPREFRICSDRSPTRRDAPDTLNC